MLILYISLEHGNYFISHRTLKGNPCQKEPNHFFITLSGKHLGYPPENQSCQAYLSIKNKMIASKHLIG